jgi:O-antigen ligase
VLVVVKPFGPYFNPTNFAAVMELAVPALAGYAWSRVRRTGREAFAERRFVLSAVGAVLCLAAGLAAASKLAALLIVVFLVLLGLIGVRGLVMRLWLLGGTVVAATSGIFLLQATRLGERVQSFLQSAESGHLLEGRLVVWRACKEMILDFPLTGAGFGAFAEMFGHYQARGARARWSQAHNDYLEVLVDGGAIAAVLVLLLSWGYLRRALPAVRRKGEISVARLGLLLGVVSLALHGFVDFNHQIPANALLFVTVAALTLSEEGKRSKGRS